MPVRSETPLAGIRAAIAGAQERELVDPQPNRPREEQRNGPGANEFA